jgi:hypothetical protein
MTKKTCFFMFAANWLPILAQLLYDTVTYTTSSRRIKYDVKYHRCVVSGQFTYLDELCLLLIPFLLVLFMYTVMLFVIIRSRQRCGRFLTITMGIIATGLLSYLLDVIANIWNIPLSYEVSQILTVTVCYTNGIVNPVIYFAAHPNTLRYVRTGNICGFKQRGERRSPVELTAMRSLPAEVDVCLPNMNVTS